MWTRLQAVVEEQAQVLIRTAFSPIVRECGDISAGIFAPDGRMLAQAVTGTPGHINTMAAAVGLMLEHVPLDAMQPGDVYTTNDPWMASGHLNDVLLVAPVFDGGTPVALTACTSHLYDLGGLGMGPNGGDVHDEGLFIPPMSGLVERGAVNSMLVRIFKANSRSPESNEGDLYALIACCEVGGRRLLEMMRGVRAPGPRRPRRLRSSTPRTPPRRPPSPRCRTGCTATGWCSTATTSRSCSKPPCR